MSVVLNEFASFQAVGLTVARRSVNLNSFNYMVVPKTLSAQDVNIASISEDEIFNSQSVPIDSLKVLGIDLSTIPAVVQFLILTSGVFVFFLLCGSVEENMFSNVPGFTFGWYAS